MMHPPAARRILTSERQIYAAFRFCRPAFHDRPIGFLDAAALEQSTELRESLAMPSENKAAGRIAIEPMRERGCARQAEPQRAEIIFQALAAFGPFVHGHSRGLVDHQYEAVAIKQPLQHLFRSHCKIAITALVWTTAKRTREVFGSDSVAGSSARPPRSAARSRISSPSAGSTMK